MYEISGVVQLDNYKAISEECASTEATLVVVTKHQPSGLVQLLYDAGHRAFGENRVQELLGKREELPKDISWHLVGHLQTNKVKQVVPFVELIHSVDSLRLLKEIDRRAELDGTIAKCLLQVHIATEETKFGFSKEELVPALADSEVQSLRSVQVCGLMGIASFTNDLDQVRAEFVKLRRLFERIREDQSEQLPYFKELSMGMSSDYKVALEEGSTMVRVGSAVFN